MLRPVMAVREQSPEQAGSSDTCLVTRVLVIDDDVELATLLAESLAREGFSLSTAFSGEEGLAEMRKAGPRIILLDVTLPGINGFEVLRQLRKESDVPVIMLTARGDEMDRIIGLEIGADDYLPKPFNVRELVARMSAILRRATTGTPGTGGDERILQRGSVRLNLATRTVWRSGEVVPLTTGEFDLLQKLLESAGVPLRREELSRSVLGREHSAFDRAIDNLVSSLRRKLGPTANGLERIKSVRNTGYLFAEADRRDS